MQLLHINTAIFCETTSIMITIKEAEIDDARSIARIHVESWQWAYQSILPAAVLNSLSIEERTQNWRHILGEKRSQVVLAYEQTEIVGWSAYGQCRDEEIGDEWCEIYAIYLEPSHTGKGIGRRLIACLVQDLAKQRYSYVSVWVLAKNLLARKFYEQLGFHQDSRVKEIEFGGTKFSEIRYTAMLSEIRVDDY